MIELLAIAGSLVALAYFARRHSVAAAGGPSSSSSEGSGSDMNRPSSAWSPPPEAEPYLAAIAAAERQNGIPRNLFARLLDQESGYVPDIIAGRLKSSAGAVGIAQLVPRYHPGVDPTDPWAAIPYAAHYLREQFDRFGSWAMALAAYNAGPTRVAGVASDPFWLERLPGETRNYVRSILGDVPAEPLP